MAARLECPDCETVLIGTRQCPGCGWVAARVAPPARSARPAAVLPEYPEPTPEDDAAAKEALHKIKALIQNTATRMGAPRERPTRPKLIPVDIDPAIRRAVDGR